MAQQLEQRAAQQRKRNLQVVVPLSSREIAVAGNRYLNFSSNDYLGLSQHPKVLGSYAASRSVGARASTLVTGYSHAHANLCGVLAEVLERPRVLLFSSAFAANVGALATLGPLYSELYLDRLAHASLLQGALQGARQTGHRWRRFQHNDLCSAQKWAAAAHNDSCLVVSESIFSMDGDALPQDALAALLSHVKNADVMIDDAHGFGVCGSDGRGVAEQFSVAEVGLLSLAFGKACGVAGGAIATDEWSADYLINFCPELIYSTAMPPAQAAAIQAAVEIITSVEGQHLREKLAANVAYFHELCRSAQLPVATSEHAIQTLQVGADATALQLSETLRSAGIWCSAIRPPTVPENTARLRITLTAAHNDDDIRQLVAALAAGFEDVNL